MITTRIYINSVSARESNSSPQEKFIIELSKSLDINTKDKLYIREINIFNKEKSKYEITYDLYFLDYNNFHFKFRTPKYTEKQALDAAEEILIEKYEDTQERCNKSKILILRRY